MKDLTDHTPYLTFYLDEELIQLGILVDLVEEVIELSPDQIEPPPRVGTRLKTEFVKGMGNYDDRFFIIQDINRIFSDDERSEIHAQKVDHIFNGALGQELQATDSLLTGTGSG